jgi:hypothetical protein
MLLDDLRGPRSSVCVGGGPSPGSSPALKNRVVNKINSLIIFNFINISKNNYSYLITVP